MASDKLETRLKGGSKPWESFEKVNETLEILTSFPNSEGYGLKLEESSTSENRYSVFKKSEPTSSLPIIFVQNLFEGYLSSGIKIKLETPQDKEILDLECINSKITKPMLKELNSMELPLTLTMKTKKNGTRSIQYNGITNSRNRDLLYFTYTGKFNSRNIEINTKHSSDLDETFFCSVRDTENNAWVVFSPLRIKGEILKLEGLDRNDQCMDVIYLGDEILSKELYALLNPSIQVRSGSFSGSSFYDNKFLSLTSLEQYLGLQETGTETKKRILLHFIDRDLMNYFDSVGYKIRRDRPFYY